MDIQAFYCVLKSIRCHYLRIPIFSSATVNQMMQDILCVRHTLDINHATTKPTQCEFNYWPDQSCVCAFMIRPCESKFDLSFFGGKMFCEIKLFDCGIRLWLKKRGVELMQSTGKLKNPSKEKEFCKCTCGLDLYFCLYEDKSEFWTLRV